VNMSARRSPNSAPINPVVTIMPVLLGTFSPAANTKPAYATAGVQKVIRRYIANHLVRIIVSHADQERQEFLPSERFVENGMEEGKQA
jgi:hypothetical protein